MAKFRALMLWTDAWIADTKHLTRCERGTYHDLLVLMWRTAGCSVPNDNEWLAKHLGMTLSEVENELRPIISEFCQSDGNRIWQKRLMQEFKWSKKRTKVASDNANRRWNKEKVSSKGDATQHSSTVTVTVPVTTKDKTLSQAVAVATRPEAFDEFWNAYPKRDGANPREPARKAFFAAIKSGTDPTEIVAGAHACAAKDRDKIGTKFIPQAVTWLHQRRWKDYATTGPPTSTGETDEQRVARVQAAIKAEQDRLERQNHGPDAQDAGARQDTGLGEAGPGDDPQLRFEGGMGDAGFEQGPAGYAVLAAAGKMRVR